MEKQSIDLAKYRLEKAKEHLKSAERLFHEKLFRDSVSRSYYAVFSSVRAMLALEKLDSKKHSGVISLFNRHFVKTGILDAALSKIIKEAKSYREGVDYEDFLNITEEEAQKQLENAAHFLNEVERKVKELTANE